MILKDFVKIPNVISGISLFTIAWMEKHKREKGLHRYNIG